MSESASMATRPKPSSLSFRLPSLDILRGIAVLGALFVTVWTFGGFSTQQQNQLLLHGKGWNYYAYQATQALLDGKMRALIALVFGAAMVLFLTKEKEIGRQPAEDVFIKRQLWLILLGIINAVLFLAPMDYLFHLGIIGILLFPFVRFSKKTLLIATLFTTLVFCGKYFWDLRDDKGTYNKYVAVTALEKQYAKDSIAKARQGGAVIKDTLTFRQKREKQAWMRLLAAKKAETTIDQDQIGNMQGLQYGKVWNQLLPSIQEREGSWTYQKGVWDFASMMLLGMLLYKLGFFNKRFSRGKYLLVAGICIVSGVLLSWYRLHFINVSLRNYEAFVRDSSVSPYLFYPIEKAAMAIGYASLILFILSWKALNKVLYVFEAAGKMALTNYLMQSLLCTIFFYGYGMGYYARLSLAELYAVAAEIILVQAVFSVLWMRFFNYGPAEWLLRRLSSGKWLPARFRKSEPGASVAGFSS
jgi:uncharacterized protein